MSDGLNTFSDILCHLGTGITWLGFAWRRDEDWLSLMVWQISSNCACLKVNLLATAQDLKLSPLRAHQNWRSWLTSSRAFCPEGLERGWGEGSGTGGENMQGPHLPGDSISSDLQTYLYPSKNECCPSSPQVIKTNISTFSLIVAWPWVSAQRPDPEPNT